MTAADMPRFLRRLVQATNAHDLDALVACFAPEYRNETPAHPARGFAGDAQVRENWRRIFDAVPDVRATVPRWAVDGTRIWSEWEMSGTRRDGTRHLMRGVIVFDVRDDRATTARFYLEPVDDADTAGIDDAVSRQVHAGTGTGRPA